MGVQTLRYKINVFRCSVQHGDDSECYFFAYLKVAKRGNLKNAHCKKKKLGEFCMVTSVNQNYQGGHFPMFINTESSRLHLKVMSCSMSIALE